MDIVHLLSVTIETGSTIPRSTITLALAALLGSVIPAFGFGPTLSSAVRTRLKHVSTKIYSRMQALALNETELSEQCSFAAVHMFDHNGVPALTRDRISKILMN